jgi:hypothetical protein
MVLLYTNQLAPEDRSERQSGKFAHDEHDNQELHDEMAAAGRRV